MPRGSKGEVRACFCPNVLTNAPDHLHQHKTMISDLVVISAKWPKSREKHYATNGKFPYFMADLEKTENGAYRCARR